MFYFKINQLGNGVALFCKVVEYKDRLELYFDANRLHRDAASLKFKQSIINYTITDSDILKSDAQEKIDYMTKIILGSEKFHR